MNSLFELIKESKYIEKNFKKTDEKIAPSERHEIISEFAENLNKNRIRDGLKPISCALVNKHLKKLHKQDLYIFLANCKEAQNFDKFYWWAMKNTLKKTL